MGAVVAFDEEDLLPARTEVRDPALEAALWMYRVVEDGGTEAHPGYRWRLEVFRNWVWSTGKPGWCFAGRWTHRMYAESKMREGALASVHNWRAGLCRAYHIDYQLEAVETDQSGTILVEKIRRHFWHDGKPRVFDGYVAA